MVSPLTSKSLYRSTAYEETGANLLFQNEEIPFIQGRSRQNRAESAESGLSCEQTESEIGHEYDESSVCSEKLYLSPIFKLHSPDLVSYTIYVLNNGDGHAGQGF